MPLSCSLFVHLARISNEYILQEMRGTGNETVVNSRSLCAYLQMFGNKAGTVKSARPIGDFFESP